MVNDGLELQQKLTFLLEEWALWMRRGGYPELGYPRSSVGFASGGISCWDDLEISVDAIRNHSVEAAVGSLPAINASAIHRRYLGALFRYESQSYAQALDEAHDILLVALPKRGVVL